MIGRFDGVRVVVMGLGRFGGGVGVTRWLAERGARILVTDLQPAEKLADSVNQIADLIDQGEVVLHLGGHDERDFVGCDLVVANPAVPKPWDNRFLRAANAAGVAITTEIRLLIERLNRLRIIGVTGTAGKSTTAAMIHHILIRAGFRAHLGGNIGGSLLRRLDTIEHDDWVVLELSSAMLYWLGEGVGDTTAEGASPHIAVMTNLQPNHLDWHGTLAHYQRCKQNIFTYQRSGDHAIRGDVDPAGPGFQLQIPGRHNQRNAQLAVTAACRVSGLTRPEVEDLLKDFEGLPHRLQLVAEHDGCLFYNDSKSTTPQATGLAAESFEDPAHVHLIAGGYDKGLDLSPIAALADRLAGLYTIGATGRGLAEAAAHGHAEFCETLDTAVGRAMARMNRGDVLLLSPGCASWDQFDNYQQRGEAFGRVVDRRIALESNPV